MPVLIRASCVIMFLNAEHSSGKYKAEFFASMGYNADNWERLEHDIREQHLSQPVKLGQPSPFGKKVCDHCAIERAEGDARQVTTVWIIRVGNDFAEAW